MLCRIKLVIPLQGSEEITDIASTKNVLLWSADKTQTMVKKFSKSLILKVIAILTIPIFWIVPFLSDLNRHGVFKKDQVIGNCFARASTFTPPSVFPPSQTQLTLFLIMLLLTVSFYALAFRGMNPKKIRK